MNESSDNKTLSCVHFGSRCFDVTAVAGVAAAVAAAVAAVVVVVFLCVWSEIETRNYRRMRDEERTKKKQDKEEEVEKKQSKMTRLLHNINLIGSKDRNTYMKWTNCRHL